MTAESVANSVTPDEECLDSGYEPELKRTLGGFQVFAVSLRVHLGGGRHLRDV